MTSEQTCPTCLGFYSSGCLTCRRELAVTLSQQAHGIHTADMKAAGCADPVAALQALADAGQSLSYRHEDSESGEPGARVWFRTTAPRGLAAVPPSSESWVLPTVAWVNPGEREAA